ncbi:Dolichol kinase [Plasmodiophora brassicae]|uniref:Dolichol kinase n=1 Tax=Plasmodiophora brassicae TaxID=37360 RepID=A0A0G4IY98_PLABS|nr:hypothetical protein PBRA_007936 [Plasmodiophora brassicae]SPQ96470.1 unnamed protein product [Plasmodiophora brassicae]
MLAPDVGGVAVPLVAIAGVLVVLYVVVTWNARVAQDDAPVAAGAVDPIQLRRKAVHICIGMSFAIIGQYVLTAAEAVAAMTTSVAIFYALHRWRRSDPKFNDTFNRLFAPVLRPRELHDLPSAFHMMVGVDLVLLLFPKPYAILATLLVTIGDPCASFFGVRLATPSSFRFANGKTLIGVTANATASFIVTATYLSVVVGDRDPVSVISQGVVGGVSSAIAELCEVDGLDDNLAIPVVSAGALMTWRTVAPSGWVSVYR